MDDLDFCIVREGVLCGDAGARNDDVDQQQEGPDAIRSEKNARVCYLCS